MPILKVEHLSKNFGGLQVVSDVNISVKKGELLGLIGPNGAGKTTIFNLLTGVYIPSKGIVDLMNTAGDYITLNGVKPHKTANMGISRTFQNIRLFKQMSVLHNVMVSQHKNIKHTMFEAIFRLPRYSKEEKRMEQRALEILDVVHLKDKCNELACNLSYGEQRRLEIARAIATDARIVFLDEPAAGMNPSETEDLAKLILDLKDRFDLTIILIEHDMKFVMNLCERIYVLDFGSIIAEGTPEQIKTNPRVIEAYLGEQA